MLRVAAHKARHIAQVVVIHGDQILVGFVIPPGHLPGGFSRAGDAVLGQLPPGGRIDRVADLLGACGRRGDLKPPGKPGLFHQILHHKFCHGAAANVAVADEKHFRHVKIFPYIVSF